MSLFFLIAFMMTICLLDSQLVQYACDPSATCGCSSRPAVVSRIYGGESAVNNSWGWAVSILINQTYYCGGVLISASWVLTTANCVQGYRASEVWLSAGTNVLLGGKQTRTASRVIQHPSFDDYWWTNNIALIHVSPPFNMTDPSISVICLPIATDEDFPPTNSSVKN